MTHSRKKLKRLPFIFSVVLIVGTTIGIFIAINSHSSGFIAQALPRRNQTPHIVYHDAQQKILRFAICKTPDCTRVRITTLETQMQKPFEISTLALEQGNDGLPTIALIKDSGLPEANPRVVKVLHCSNQSCSNGYTTSHITPKGNFSAVALASGNDGHTLAAYVAPYFGGTVPLGIHVVHCGNPACTAGNTDALVTAQSSKDVSIATGSDGLPIVAFAYNDSTGPGAGNERANLAVIHCGDHACASNNQTNVIVSTTFSLLASTYAVEPAHSGKMVRVLIGSDGLPLITFWKEYKLSTTNYQAEFKAVHCGSIDCSSGNTTVSLSPLISQTGYGSHSLEKGADGFPVISYHANAPIGGGGGEELRVIKCSSNDCANFTTTVLDNDGYEGGYWQKNNVLGVNQSGNPVISYNDQIDSTTEGFKVISCGNADCSSGNTVSVIDAETGWEGMTNDLKVF